MQQKFKTQKPSEQLFASKIVFWIRSIAKAQNSKKHL